MGWWKAPPNVHAWCLLSFLIDSKSRWDDDGGGAKELAVFITRPALRCHEERPGGAGRGVVVGVSWI